MEGDKGISVLMTPRHYWQDGQLLDPYGLRASLQVAIPALLEGRAIEASAPRPQFPPGFTAPSIGFIQGLNSGNWCELRLVNVALGHALLVGFPEHSTLEAALALLERQSDPESYPPWKLWGTDVAVLVSSDISCVEWRKDLHGGLVARELAEEPIGAPLDRRPASSGSTMKLFVALLVVLAGAYAVKRFWPASAKPTAAS